MSRLIISSDWHLGHRNILKFRKELGFKHPDQHHEFVLSRAKAFVKKGDTLYLLGDIAFTKEWLMRIKEIKCRRKVLFLGNHDLERDIKMSDLLEVFDEVLSLGSKRNCWFTHCPMHTDEVRRKKWVIHGHTHKHLVDEDNFINVCLEHTNYEPVTFESLEKLHAKQLAEKRSKRSLKDWAVRLLKRS